jgi:hypothetical protein
MSNVHHLPVTYSIPFTAEDHALMARIGRAVGTTPEKIAAQAVANALTRLRASFEAATRNAPTGADPVEAHEQSITAASSTKEEGYRHAGF